MRISANGSTCTDGRGGQRDTGFALLIVLLALTLLGLVTARLLSAARSQIVVAGNLRDATIAGAAAKAGIADAIVHLEAGGTGPVDKTALLPATQLRGLWHTDDTRHVIRIGASRVTIRIAALDGKVNPNSAPPAVLAGLIRAVGTPAGAAERIAAAIIAWRSPAPSQAAQRALASRYRQAGRSGAPDGTGFATIDALGAVLGMTPSLLASLRPHLSLSAPAVPRRGKADPIVRTALKFAGADALNVPAGSVEAAPVAEIESVASGPGRARAALCETVRLTPANIDAPYRIVTARRGLCAGT